MTYNPKWLENSPDTELGGFDGATGLDTVVPTQKAVKSFIYDLTGDVKDPSGIANRASTSLSYDTTSTPGQCTVTIAPDGEDIEVYLLGKKYVFDSAQSVVLTDTEGMHYVYFNASGTLVSTTTWNPNIILEWAFVAAVYWNAADNEVVYFGDERHGINMSGATHYNLHNAQGTVYLTGLALGDIIADSTSATNADAQFSIAQGQVLDEDIATVIPDYTAPANIPMYYLSGTSDWRKSVPDDYPVLNSGSGRVAWNENTGTWALTEATDGYFVLTHVFATNDMDNPMIGVVGQNEYATLSEARDGAENEISDILTSSLPFQEFVAVATVIFETDDTFGNTPKAVIRSTNSGGDYQDWRLSALSPAAGSPADHGQLSGLGDDDHIQYAILTGLRAFTGEQEFAAGIDVSAGDITVANNTDVIVGATSVTSFGTDSQRLGVVGDTSIDLTQSTDVIGFTVAGSSIGTFESDGLTLASGTNINEFSTDGTLGDDSDNAVPTEAAVKTYVDNAVAGLTLNKIYQGDSYVVVLDSTASGEIRVVADDTEMAIFTSSAATLGPGEDGVAASGGFVKADANGVVMGDGSLNFFQGDADEAILGSIDNNLYIDMSNDIIQSQVGGQGIITATPDEQVFGFLQSGFGTNIGAGVAFDQNNQTATLYASEQNYLEISDSTSSATTTTTTGTTLKYFDQGREVMRMNNEEQFVGDTADGWDYSATKFGIGKDDEYTGYYFVVYNSSNVNALIGDDSVRIGDPGTLGYFFGTSSVAEIVAPNNAGRVEVSNNGASIGENFKTKIGLNHIANSISFTTNGTIRMTLDDTGLSLQNGTNINEFSTDGTLSGDSNDAVPTENAVKTYVDNAIGGAVDHNSTTGKQGGDATSVEYYHLIADVYNQLFATSATVAGIGDSASSNVEVNNTTNTVTIDANTTEVASFTDAIQQIGLSGDTFVSVNQTLNTVSITAGNESQIVVETTGTTVYDDLTVSGNLFVDGTTFVVNNQEVTTADNIIVVNNGEVGPGVTAGSAGIEVDRGSLTNYQFLFVEASDTFRIGEVGSLQAVATREDSPGNMRVAWWNDTAKRFDTLGNSYITVNTTTDTVVVTANSATQATFDTNGLTLSTGASVVEFSIDGTLSDDSNDQVPTEQAVKTYVDNAISSFAANKIEDGDSFVIVNDGTGGAGEVRIVVDGVEVGYYDALATSQRMGKADGSFILTSDEETTISGPDSVEVFSAEENTFQMGYWTEDGPFLQIDRSGDPSIAKLAADTGTYIQLDSTASAEIAMYVDALEYVTINESLQTFGQTTGGRLQTTDSTAGVFVDSEIGLVTSSSAVTLGDRPNGTYLHIYPVSDQYIFYVNNLSPFAVAASGVNLRYGTTVNEFSTDGTLAGNSDDAVPTEKAVKTYVDNAIGGVDTVRFVDTDTTAVAGDIVLVDSTAGPVNVELIETEDGRITIKKITNDSNTVTITTSPGLIDGKASATIDTPYQAYGFVSDGSNFYII
jgi:hypothetical protein